MRWLFSHAACISCSDYSKAALSIALQCSASLPVNSFENFKAKLGVKESV
ncbi:MAG: hypothetical protein RR827_04850 [Oscillospiraceae bacterium]